MSERSLIERWSWERPVRRLIFWGFLVPTAVAGVIICYLSLFAGAMVVLMGLLFGLMNVIHGMAIEKRMERLQASWHPVPSEPEICLVVNGLVSAPGLVAIVDGYFMLKTFFGGTVRIPLEQIAAVRETYFLNGLVLTGKTGFWLTVPGRRVGFAVPSSDAPLWRERLSRPRTSAQVRD